MIAGSSTPLLLKFTYDAGPHVPPPHYHQYTIIMEETTSGLQVQYEVRYLHREELTEEEIMDEGFSLHDDWSVQEELPLIWAEALRSFMDHNPLQQLRENGAEGPSLWVEVKAGAAKFKGHTAAVDAWNYFLQEVIQALLEASGQEMPFVLHYLEMENKQAHREIELEASFVQRSITVSSKKMGKLSRTKEISWQRLPEIMQQVLLPEYDYEKALSEQPKRNGIYLSTGDGMWFEWGKSLVEPKGESTSLLKLKSLIKQLAAKEETGI